MDAPQSPTTSTSTPSSPSSSTAGATSDPGSAVGTAEHTPPRRRLVKATSRSHFDEQPPRVSSKREGGGGGTGPPGFVFDRSSGTPSPTSAGMIAGPASSALGVPSVPAGIAGTFRDRGVIRPNVKGDVQGDYNPLGPAGGSGPPKLGRPPFAANPGITDVRPLGRRAEVGNLRRHETSSGQKHAEDMRIQQAKRARTQTLGAPGNYRSFDSQFGNFLVPVIPNQFFSKTPPSPSTPAAPSVTSQGSR